MKQLQLLSYSLQENLVKRGESWKTNVVAKKRRKHRKPLSLGEILSGQTGSLRGATLVDLYRVQRSWKAAVGEALAKRTFPKRVQGRCLIVAAESPAWSTHLSLMKEQILGAIAEHTGKTFRDLRFVTESIPDVEALWAKSQASGRSFVRPEVIEDLPTLLKRIGRLRQEFEAHRKKAKANSSHE